MCNIKSSWRTWNLMIDTGQFHFMPYLNTRPNVNFLKCRTKEHHSIFLLTYRTKPSVWVVCHNVRNAARGFLSLPEVKYSKTVKIIFKQIHICKRCTWKYLLYVYSVVELYFSSLKSRVQLELLRPHTISKPPWRGERSVFQTITVLSCSPNRPFLCCS